MRLLIDVDPIGPIAELAKTVLEEPSPEILTSHLALKILSNLDCRGVVLGVIQREGFLDVIGSYGFPQEVISKYERMPLWTPLPITDSARTGEIYTFNGTSEVMAKYPNVPEMSEHFQGVNVTAPIKFRNTVIGAAGFTFKQAPSANFEKMPTTQAILALCGIYLKNFLKNKVEPERDYSETTKSLTQRQKQIIALFKEDLTTDQMANRLKYSSSTIKQDIIKIYNIFGVSSRTAVLELAQKAGLTEVTL